MPAHQTPDDWFAPFYAAVSRTVWDTTAPVRARMFHGGIPCDQQVPPALTGARRANEHNTMCELCCTFHTQNVWVIGEKYRRQSAAGNLLDPVRFARSNAKDRFEDTVLKEDGAAHGTLQKPKRTVEESAWIDDALDGDPRSKELLYLYLRFVQGRDPVEPGSPLPFHRWTDKLGMDSAAATEDLAADVVRRLRAVRPAWVEVNIDAHTRHLTGHCIIDHDDADDDRTRVAEQLADHRVDVEQENVDRRELELIADAIGRAVNHPDACSDADGALFTAIAATHGRRAAENARSSAHWSELTRHVSECASNRAA